MAWVKLDDHFPEHPKLASLRPIWRLLAQHVYVNALCWCNRHMTDGLVPYGVVNRLAADCDGLEVSHMPPIRTEQVVRELVAVGLWEETPDGDYRIHDYLDYQPSREQAAALAAIRRDAGRHGGIAKAQQRASNLPSNGQSKDLAKPCPVPVPVPLKDLDHRPTEPGRISTPVEKGNDHENPRVLVKLAHQVLEQQPESDADAADLLKTEATRANVTWTRARDIAKALESAVVQRRKAGVP